MTTTMTSAHDMTPRRHWTKLAGPLAAAAIAIACGKAPPLPPPAAPPPLTIAAPPEASVKASLTIAVAGDANPDRNGRPSQVIVRIYQLRTDSAFAAADLLPLYDDEKAILGPELISRDEFVLQPADSRTIDVAVSKETRFIGAIVPFRDDRNAQWRALLPVTKGGVKVDVGRASVMLSAVP
jgi:type VI secretion system protein VasD